MGVVMFSALIFHRSFILVDTLATVQVHDRDKVRSSEVWMGSVTKEDTLQRAGGFQMSIILHVITNITQHYSSIRI